MSLTIEQLAIRRDRIGSSEIGALLGVDPHRGPMEVFTDKVMPETRPAASDAQEWGSQVEWAIIEFHARVAGLKVHRPGTLVHPDHKFICATPDAIGARGPHPDQPRVIEVKNVGRWMAAGWGEEGDDAPFHYLAQVHWELGATVRLGLSGPHGDLVAAIAGEAPRVFPVQFDPELYQGLVEIAAKFVRDHLETGKPPPATPTQEAEYIRRRYAKHDLTLLEPTPELTALVHQVAWLRQQSKALGAELVTAENALKTAIGEAGGIAGLCTWKSQKRAEHTVKESSFRVLRLLKTQEES